MRVRAVLFDFGGTLYDYATLGPGNAESLVAVARWAGVEVHPEAIARTHQQALRRVFNEYLPRPFYLHRDLFRDTICATLDDLGASADEAVFDRYRQLQWKGHERDFALREGVIDTLEALRARGVHVGMVSNIDDDQLEHLLELSGLEPYFDSILSSERARSCKPDGAIFAQALRRAGCRDREALFVGDSRHADVAGANAAGMISVLIWHRADRDPPDEDPRAEHVISRIPELLEIVR